MSCGTSHVGIIDDGNNLYTWGCGGMGRLGPFVFPLTGLISMQPPVCVCVCFLSSSLLGQYSFSLHNKTGLHDEMDRDRPCKVEFMRFFAPVTVSGVAFTAM